MSSMKYEYGLFHFQDADVAGTLVALGAWVSHLNRPVLVVRRARGDEGSQLIEN